MNTKNAPLVNALVSLGGTITNAMDDDPEFVPCGRPAAFVMSNVAALAADQSAEELAQRVQATLGLAEHVSEHHGAKLASAYEGEISPIKAELLDSLVELTGITAASLERGAFDPTVNAYFYRSLASIAGDDAAAEAQLSKLAGIMERARSL